MNKLKGKVEAYVVSTMEDNQRTSLLDNLSMSTEKVEEEAERALQTNGKKVVHRGEIVDDLCNSILAILDHELRIIQTRQKPSFWVVAENITPKETIQMIYRLDIKQTDNSRCHAWLRHSLEEATIGSFMSMFTQDARLLKEFYKPSAFLRDALKVETTLNLINCTIATVQFLVFDNQCGDRPNLNNILPEVPQEILYTNRRNSSTSLDSTASTKKRRGRVASANIAIIADTSTIDYDDASSFITSDYNLSESLTEEITSLKTDKLTDENPHSDVIFNGRTNNENEIGIKRNNLAESNESEGEKEKWTVQMDQVNLRVANVKEETNDDLSKSHDEPNSNDTDSSTEPSSTSLQHSLSQDSLDTSGEMKEEIKGHSDKEVKPANSVHDMSCGDDDSTLSINVLNALNHSESSPFQRINTFKDNRNKINSGTQVSTCQTQDLDDKNKLHRIISVIKSGEVKLFSETEVLMTPNVGKETDIINDDRVVSPSEEYKNQEGSIPDFLENSPSNEIHGGGSQQLVNILQLSTSGSYNEDYYIPGIHKSPDIEIMQKKSQNITTTREENLLSISVGNSFNSSVKSYNKYLSNRKTPNSLSLKNDTSYSDTDSDTLSTSDISFNILTDLGINGDFIGMKEDHFSTPDTFMGFSSTEELENAISTCKHLIKQSPEQSARRKELVQQLVHLRLKLHEIKDKSEEELPKDVKKVLGHQFTKQNKVVNSITCDCCSATIYPMLQDIYQCKDCGFHCHRKCLKTLDKGCIFNKRKSNESYRLNICPEGSLSQQQYRCADCHQRFTHSDGSFQIRLCDYTGQWYCLQCHWNESSVIPARVIHNWDFQTQKVSRNARQILQLRCKKPDIRLQELNPALFNFVDELRSVRNLRENLIMVKEYIQTCRIAKEDRMLLQLMSRQHFVDNSFVYSMQDLMDINSDVLLPEIRKKYSLFVKHIKEDCPLCNGKGFICEICNSDEIIFPFDENVVLCKQCKAAFHRSCISHENCPRCERTVRRKQNKEKENSNIS